MGLKQVYKTSENQVIYGGVPISGFGPDDIISVEQIEPNVTIQIGLDGQGCHTQNANRSYRITVTLYDYSTDNAAMQALMYGNVPLPLIIKNPATLNSFFAADAMVSGPPPLVFGKENKPVTWEMLATLGEIFYGGHRDA